MKIDRRTPILTIAILVLTLAVFAVELLTGALDMPISLVTFGVLSGPVSLVELGARVNALIAYGEWWRLITPVFLHGSFQHVLFNMLSLWIWGRYAEALHGRVRYGLVYLLSGIAGNILGFALSSPYTIAVGASGAVFGLFGSFLYLRFYNKEIFHRVFGTQVIILVIANLVMSVFSPNIDLWGHAGGLVGGFLTAAACGLYGSHASAKWRVAGSVGYIILFGGLLAYGLWRYTPLLG